MGKFPEFPGGLQSTKAIAILESTRASEISVLALRNMYTRARALHSTFVRVVADPSSVTQSRQYTDNAQKSLKVQANVSKHMHISESTIQLRKALRFSLLEANGSWTRETFFLAPSHVIHRFPLPYYTRPTPYFGLSGVIRYHSPLII